MKKIFIVFLICLAVFLIYLGLQDKKIYYVSMGDYMSLGLSDSGNTYGYSDYISDYLTEKNILEEYDNLAISDNRATDLIRDINNNKKIGEKTLKNILIKADLLTISIGYNDVLSKLDKYNAVNFKNYLSNYLNDLDDLYKLIREYTKEDIVMIGYYNIYQNAAYDNTINYLNDETKKICDKYNIHFINIGDITQYHEKNYPSIQGYHVIFDKIRQIIDQEILD